MHIVFAYAALLALLFVGLSFRTLNMRRRLRIAVGDKGNEAMLRAMRVHSNFAEYVPLALLLIYFVEETGAPKGVIHGLCLSLLIGRMFHAYGVSQVNEKLAFRVIGMILTFASLITASVRLLLPYVTNVAT